jgi:hypothetical protein
MALLKELLTALTVAPIKSAVQQKMGKENLGKI